MSDIKKSGEKYLAANKDVDTVYLTVDGQLFLSENYAQLHARSLPKNKQAIEKVEKVEQVDKPAKQKTESDLLTDSKEIIALLEETDDLKVIDAYEEAEKTRKKSRKTVLETIAAKREDLTKEA